MSPHVLMVHGRSQQRKDEQLLELEWENALARGLIAAGGKALPAENTVFSYYGGLYSDYALRLDGISAAARNRADAREFETEFAKLVAKKVSQRGIELKPDVIPGGDPQALKWYDGILQVLERIPGFGTGVVRGWLRDVHDYLSDFNGLRGKTMAIVSRDLAAMQNRRPLVLIAHSLGSIVCYDVLRTRPDLTVDLFITIGSPLGIDSAVRNRLLGFKKNADNVPANIRTWVNFADEDDIVALDETLNDDLAAKGQKRIRDLIVKNSKSNPHSSADYLAQAELGKVILATAGGAAMRAKSSKKRKRRK